MINATHIDDLMPDTDYDEQNDVCFYKLITVPDVQLTMIPGSFAIFFSQDSHYPSTHTADWSTGREESGHKNKFAHVERE